MKKKLLLSLVIALLVLSALCLVSCGDSPRANFYFLIVPFAWLIRQFSSWFGGNYILILLFFALVIKIVFLPLSIHQQKNQIKGAKLRPQMALIEKKYEGLTDQDSQMKKRNELMEMQQRANYSPMSGCLPLILQMVIVIVLYGVIRAPMTYLAQMDNNTVAEVYNVAYDISTSEEYGIGDANKYASKNIDKIEIPEEGELPWTTVQGIDQFKLVEAARAYPDEFAAIEGFSAVKDKVPSLMVGKINLADTPSFNCKSGVSMWLLLIPLLNFALAVVTMRLTKKFSGNLQAELAGQTQDQRASTAIMDWMMPLMNLAFTFMFQAVLGVYWIFQSVLALVQMLILNKLMPMPTFTEEEIQAYKKSLNERPAANRDPNRPRPRSLHHIDDDDDDIPAPAPRIEANKRNPNTSKKKAKNYDERQRQAAREEARINREQRKEEEKAAAEEKRLSAKEAEPDDTTPAQATDVPAVDVTAAETTPAETASPADDDPTEKADS